MQHSLRFSYVSPFFALIALALLFPQASHAAQITISITDSGYVPNSVTINPGDTVRWVNNGSSAHTVTSDEGSFDSVSLATGQSFAAVFNLAGNYAYHCRLHPNGGHTAVVKVVAPAPAPSATSSAVSTLQAQVQMLLNQLNVLKSQQGTAGASSGSNVVLDSSSCPQIGRALKRGVSGTDVTRLQQFLARDKTIYPEGTVTGYYGALTERAVQRWQAKYNVVSSGTPDSTGYGVVGPRTAAAIALLCTTGSYGGVSVSLPPVTTPQVGALITVTPITGKAPLAVNVTTTVNTTNSCQAATYLLDFGDQGPALQIPVAAGTCTQQVKTFPYTYKYGGDYTVKLSAEGHSTTATVSVDGPPRPVFTPGLPKESFNVTPLSGAAPLTVTFSGVVNSNNAGFCEEGCASVLDFGDGSQAMVDLPGSVGGWLNYSVTHTYTQSGGFRATLYQGGAGASQPIVGSATIVVGFGNPAPAPVITPATTTASGTAGSYAYSLPVVTPSGVDPLRFNISFDLPSTCTGFEISWGDSFFGSEGQADGGTTCAQTPVQKTFTHQYAEIGTYTIILKRGPTLSRIDQSVLTLSSN